MGCRGENTGAQRWMHSTLCSPSQGRVGECHGDVRCTRLMPRALDSQSPLHGTQIVMQVQQSAA